MKTFSKSITKKDLLAEIEKHRKGEVAQDCVANLLSNNGFDLVEINKITSNGLDIVAIKSGKYYLIEVKTVIKNTRSYVVNKIHDKAEYVFVLLPSGHIYIEDGDSWRKLTDKAGRRGFTKIVEIYSNLGSAAYTKHAKKLLSLLRATQ